MPISSRIAPSLLFFVLLSACDEGSTAMSSGKAGSPSTAGQAAASGGNVGAGGQAGSAGTAGSNGGAPVTRQAEVTVSGSTPRAVPSTFFGQNYWSWVNAWGDPVAAVRDQAAQLGLRLLRAGGGNNDKQDPEAFSLSEIDAFVAYARAIGAEPLLQVPVIKNIAGTAATAQDAADLVTYVNRTKAYGIRYFSIGNEPDLYTEQGLKNADWDAAAFCTMFTDFVAAMKAVDPSIQVLGPDLSWKYQSGNNDWLTPFLQDCGNQVDAVVVHRYPLDPTACTETAALGDGPAFRQTIQHLRSIMSATGQAAKPLGFTEGNITWDGDPAKSTMAASPGTFPAGLWLADSLGVGLEEGLFSFAYWSLSEGWTLGFLAGTSPRPAYHVMQLFSTKFGDQALTVSGAPSGVSVYAGRSASQAKSNVFVVNKTRDRLELTVSFEGLPRNDVPTLTAEPISLLVAELPDDGSKPLVTSFAAGMTGPAVVSN